MQCITGETGRERYGNDPSRSSGYHSRATRPMARDATLTILCKFSCREWHPQKMKMGCNGSGYGFISMTGSLVSLGAAKPAII
jgi:hypothetical protein